MQRCHFAANRIGFNSYRTVSYNVSMVYLNAYDPVCPIGIKNCYVC